MITHKPKQAGPVVDDRKLAVIEHLTGERLSRKNKLQKRLPCILHSFVAVAVYCVIILMISVIAVRMITG